MSDKDEKINELNSQIDSLVRINEEQFARINNLLSEMRTFESRLISAVTEEADDNDYCLEGQIEFVAKVLGKSLDQVRPYFIETYKISIDFTGPAGLDKYLNHFSDDDAREFIDTYLQDHSVGDVSVSFS